MLRSLRELIEALRPPPPRATPAEREHALQLATAVLLVEVMRSDADLGVEERRTAVAALREKFALADAEIERLIELAEHTARGAHDYHQFTSRINDAFTPEQKLRIVEWMWQVAYADGRLDAHEKHVLWRLADLLHVPHGAYIGAKMRARQAAGAAPDGPGA